MVVKCRKRILISLYLKKIQGMSTCYIVSLKIKNMIRINGREIMNMKKILLFLNLIIWSNSFSQNLVWEKNFFQDGFATTGPDTLSANSIAVDSSGNVYTCGHLANDTADFDPNAGTFNLGGTSFYDTYISKLDASGNFIWARKMGYSNTTNSYLILDNSNNIYVVNDGYWAGGEINISKLDASGNIIWSKAIASGSFLFLGYKSKAICIDEFGNLYVTGYFSNGTVDFDPGIGISNLTSASGVIDLFLLKLDNIGSFIWVKQFSTGVEGPPYYDRGNSSVATDSAGGIYLGGSFRNTTDFDPNVGVNNITSSGLTDVFITKLNSAGNFIWAKSMGGSADDQLRSIVIDKYGNVYTTGNFIGISDFNPGVGVNNLSSTIGSSDIFICKLDSFGNYKWAKSFAGVYDDNSYSLVVDINDNVLTTGYYAGTVDFNPNAGVFNLSSLSSTIDIFVSKLDSAGNFINALTFPGTGWESAYCITTDNSGNIFLTGDIDKGSTGGTTDFDPGTGVFIVNTMRAALFVLKLGNTVSSVHELASNSNNVDIYPNPANDLINVKVNSNLINSKYYIINSLGQNISSGKLTNENTTINIEGLPNGIYLFQVGPLNQHSFKIVKNN